MMWGVGGGIPFAGWGLSVLVLAVLVAGMVWLLTRVASSRDDSRGNARRILDERFASGDISPEEYESRRRALR